MDSIGCVLLWLFCSLAFAKPLARRGTSARKGLRAVRGGCEAGKIRGAKGRVRRSSARIEAFLREAA
jgi:hypothetical protein